ncbi:golgin_subfamily B member 1-like [Hexamita inflata]|uniref:Golgin subfamily B member 1-like n=1 Tax=Hexamita inflata TaxID=28002 RepID=A0AA86P6N7_9EUKA|nr:golgin subfamily B member 1-like [Hexamita inflata]
MNTGTVMVQKPLFNTIKADSIINGLNLIQFDDDQIQFNNYSDRDKKNYINTKTGQTNFLIDVSQLEGKEIKDFTINNLTSTKINLNSRDVGVQLGELYHGMQLNTSRLNNMDTTIQLVRSQIDVHTFDIDALKNKVQTHQTKIDELNALQENQILINQNFEQRFEPLEQYMIDQNIINQNLITEMNNINTKIIEYDQNFKYQTEINNKIVDKLTNHQDRLDVIGPQVRKISDNYLTSSDISNMATNSDVIGLSIGIAVVGLDAISATGIAASALSTAGAAAATGAANSSAIGVLQTQVTELRTEGGMLKGDMEATKVDVQTVKADAVTTKSAFTKFVASTQVEIGTLQGQVTDIYANKANKEDVYNKGEIDAHFETQDVTNQTVNLSLGNLGILKANVQDVYDKSSNDQQLSLKANTVDVYTKANVDMSLALKSDKTYVDTGFNLYGSQLTTLKNRADNVDILNNTQNTNITNLQNSNVTLNNGMNTAFSRLQVIDNLNTQQSSSIVSLQTDNTTNKTDIDNLKTSDTKQNTDISALQTRCTDIQTDINTTQNTILEIHTGNFGQINDNFTNIWGRLVKIEETDLTGVIGRLDQIDENLGDTMTSTYYLLQENTKNKENITALQNDNTTNKSNITTAQTNITNLTSRMNEQDQTNLTFGGKITTLQTDNTKNKNDIFTINNSISTINNNITALTTRVTNLETFVYNFVTSGTGYDKIGNLVWCYGYAQLTAGNSIYVNYAVTMTQVISYKVQIIRDNSNGSGCDVTYTSWPELTRMKITHDFASTSGVDWVSWEVRGKWK